MDPPKRRRCFYNKNQRKKVTAEKTIPIPINPEKNDPKIPNMDPPKAKRKGNMIFYNRQFRPRKATPETKHEAKSEKRSEKGPEKGPAVEPKVEPEEKAEIKPEKGPAVELEANPQEKEDTHLPKYPEKIFVDPNVEKEDTPLYKDDANVTVLGVKGKRLCENWNEMNFDEQLLVNIRKCGFIWPRKIQEAVLPFVVDGYDVQCQSETGTGKTASYLIQLIDNLIKEKQKLGNLRKGAPYCIIISPTREFTEQIFQDARKLVNDTEISVVASYGGISLKATRKAMSKGCNILCTCLGRLLNLIKYDYDRHKYLCSLKYIVFDDVDHLIEGNQKADFLKLNEYLLPVDKRQTLFFSPTLHNDELKKIEDEENKRLQDIVDKKVEKEKMEKEKMEKEKMEKEKMEKEKMEKEKMEKEKMEKEKMEKEKMEKEKMEKEKMEKGKMEKEKLEKEIKTVAKNTEAANSNPTNSKAAKPKKEKPIKKVVLYNRKKFVYITSVLESNQRIKYIIESLPSDNSKFSYLKEYISNISSSCGRGNSRKIIIFVNEIKIAEQLAERITTDGFPADVIHSKLKQWERDEALSNFKNGDTDSRILVSVNICSYGIDIPEMDYVINYHLPDSKKSILEARNIFLQRCGRIGRIEHGTAITFYVNSSKDRLCAPWLRKILQNANQKVPDFLKDKSDIETYLEQLSVK